jgi:hypothetical protein
MNLESLAIGLMLCRPWVIHMLGAGNEPNNKFPNNHCRLKAAKVQLATAGEVLS